MLTISTEGVTRYHVTPAEVGEARMPVPCFLVAHPKGTLMWDVGVIPDELVEKQASAGGARYDVNSTAAALVKRTLKSQLEEIGYVPADITYVAISHAHKDHSANLNQFAGSTWLVTPAEREFMWKPGNERVEPSFYNKLEKSKSISIEKDEYDVFGDGTVLIKAAPGHTPGHQVLVLRLAVDGTSDARRRSLSLSTRAHPTSGAARQRIQRAAVCGVSFRDRGLLDEDKNADLDPA